MKLTRLKAEEEFVGVVQMYEETLQKKLCEKDVESRHMAVGR